MIKKWRICNSKRSLIINYSNANNRSRQTHSNKTDEITLICAKFGKDLSSIFKVIADKSKRARFFRPTLYIHFRLWVDYLFIRRKVSNCWHCVFHSACRYEIDDENLVRCLEALRKTVAPEDLPTFWDAVRKLIHMPSFFATVSLRSWGYFFPARFRSIRRNCESVLADERSGLSARPNTRLSDMRRSYTFSRGPAARFRVALPLQYMEG